MLVRFTPGAAVQRIHLDLVVEVADVADDGLVLHVLHVVQRDDVQVAGAGDINIAAAERIFHRGHFEAFHRGLQRVDRIDLGDNHARAHAAQRVRRALAHIAVAADDRYFARHHHIGGALDPIGQRLAAAIQIVELRLGHRVIHVDGGNQQLALFLHLVQPMHARGGLFRNSAPILHDVVPVLGIFGVDLLQQVLDHHFFVARRWRIHPLDRHSPAHSPCAAAA